MLFVRYHCDGFGVKSVHKADLCCVDEIVHLSSIIFLWDFDEAEDKQGRRVAWMGVALPGVSERY